MKKFLAFGFLVTLLCLNSFAGTITQSYTFSSAAGDAVARSTSFNLFGSAGAPVGAILNAVNVDLDLTETLNSVTVQTGSRNSQTTSYTLSTIFTADNSIDQAESDAVNTAVSLGSAVVYASGFFHIDRRPATATLGPGTLTYDTGELTRPVDAYAGPGSFLIDYSTTSTASTTGSQVGPISTDLITFATISVTYDYTTGLATPEPGSMLLLGGALVALALLRFTRSVSFR